MSTQEVVLKDSQGDTEVELRLRIDPERLTDPKALLDSCLEHIRQILFEAFKFSTNSAAEVSVAPPLPNSVIKIVRERKPRAVETTQLPPLPRVIKPVAAPPSVKREPVLPTWKPPPPPAPFTKTKFDPDAVRAAAAEALYEIPTEF